MKYFVKWPDPADPGLQLSEHEAHERHLSGKGYTVYFNEIISESDSALYISKDENMIHLAYYQQKDRVTKGYNFSNLKNGKVVASYAFTNGIAYAYGAKDWEYRITLSSVPSSNQDFIFQESGRKNGLIRDEKRTTPKAPFIVKMPNFGEYDKLMDEPEPIRGWLGEFSSPTVILL